MQKQTAIYVRRSVSDKDKGNNSLSIDSQKTECVKSLAEGEVYRIYCDDGKSAKNVEGRPAFQQMMSDAKNGMIERIIVKKYDRFSRNMREYLNVTNTLDSYGVSVFSLTEPFNTATKQGRMMRNNLLNFAEIKAYELYKEPKTSLGDIFNYFNENRISTKNSAKSNMDRSQLSGLLKSPLYVRADKEVYQYLISKGYEIIDDVKAFDGVHGLFRHSRKGEVDYIKVGYHEGLIDAETWLAVQDKKSRNQRIPNNKRATHTWLSGLTKCGHCGYCLSIQTTFNVSKTTKWRYYYDNGAYRANGCIKKRLKLKPDEVESIVFNAMKERIKTLEISKKESKKPNAEVDNLKADVIGFEDEIRKLMDKLAEADDVLFAYIQERVKSLHEKKSALEEKIRNKARKQKVVDTAPLSDPLRSWENLTINQKHDLATEMLEVVYVSDEKGVEIKFSI